MKFIVGLGNPGDKYQNTRHNLGFMFLDYLSQELGFNWREEKKFQAMFAKDGNFIFLKPLTFMNNSGIAVEKAMSYFKALPKKNIFQKQKNSDLSKTLLIVHDDLDIEFGEYKISVNAGSAGHNGVQSVINHLKTKNFMRIRIGIKPSPDNKVPIEKYVLQKFDKNSLKQINTINKDIAKEIKKF